MKRRFSRRFHDMDFGVLFTVDRDTIQEAGEKGEKVVCYAYDDGIVEI